MNDWEGYVKDVDYLLFTAGLFLPELKGWGRAGKILPRHPSTLRGRNGFTGFKEARQDFQKCIYYEPGVIVGGVLRAELFLDPGPFKNKPLACF